MASSSLDQAMQKVAIEVPEAARLYIKAADQKEEMKEEELGPIGKG